MKIKIIKNNYKEEKVKFICENCSSILEIDKNYILENPDKYKCPCCFKTSVYRTTDFKAFSSTLLNNILNDLPYQFTTAKGLEIACIEINSSFVIHTFKSYL